MSHALDVGAIQNVDAQPVGLSEGSDDQENDQRDIGSLNGIYTEESYGGKSPGRNREA